jgi:O-antigen/teichoic acid export membrane protein
MQTIESSSPSRKLTPGHHLIQGTLLVFMAEALLPLTGIVTASFLTRSLGAGNYGLLTLASTLISWIELAINSLFSRATVKFVSGAGDWRPVGAAILRLHIYVSTAAFAACWLLAKPCAALLGEPKLAEYLALFAIDIPLFSLAHCHRSLLVGRGRYTERAAISAGRWTTRLVLVIGLVELGFSVNGAILGSIGATLVELAIARYYIRPSWSVQRPVPASLWDYAIPIFLAALSLRFMGMGLFMLKLLGASAAEAGIYGAAQNLSFVMPGILAVSISPLLLSTLTRVLRENDLFAARALSRNAIRTVLAILPFAVAAAEASDEIAIFFFGRHFAGSGPLMAILIFAGLAMIMINMQNAILIACGNPSWVLKLTAPLLPAAIVGHLIAIPLFKSIGAAAVTTLVTALGALIGLIAIRRRLQIKLPCATFLRAGLLSAFAYLLMHLWPAQGLVVPAKIGAIFVLIGCGYLLSGELQRDEIRFFRSLMYRLFVRK